MCWCTWLANMEIPATDSFSHPTRSGHLLKLTGRGWFSSGSWKGRFCILDNTKLYFYENKHSKGHEKSCGVISLDYYDCCEAVESTDKKNPHVFVVATSVRGFFDNRHQFSAESAEKMLAWIQAIQDAIAEARANRGKAGRKRHLEGKSPNLSSSSQESEGPASTDCLVGANKNRTKGPQGRRLPQRKSMFPMTASPKELEMRQRSISLSSPEGNNQEETPSSEDKWQSVSMEEVDQSPLEEEEDDRQKSSSTADLPPHNSRIYQKRALGKLGGQQHMALAKELEMRLKIGPKRPETVLDVPRRDSAGEEDIEALTAKVRANERGLSALEERVKALSVLARNGREESMVEAMAAALKDAERNAEDCKKALLGAEKARTEYEQLRNECQQVLESLQNAHTQNESTEP